MKYIFDYSKLVDKIYTKGLTYHDMAEALGISERTYIMKMSNLAEFTQNEIDVMATIVLDIPPERIPEYFFKLVV